ncbi:MAG: hypothetical protein COZ85_03340 [Candidatus Moranbacteria bacterium CG_4_8_14_3_um_filter_34_16]|nr:MAG: hypothetical protein COT31_00210 [Candidatus Moranbacteria bacterium CG08_land_8_20_14_0_20_34_16]PIW94775.1 MAG: hypothetical protein COZ85_03340 [Candidatus Moranbacteria bacterium CG_4_8_14_3_um_filter_34_16]
MLKTPFSKMSQWIKIERCTIPHSVFVTKNPDEETFEQLVELQNRFLQLPMEIRMKLNSYRTGEKIQRIGRMYNLNLLQMADIARVIRSFYFKEISLNAIAKILEKEMKVKFDVAQKISDFIVKEIIQDDSFKKEYQLKFAKLSLFDAIKEYPEINEQLVTEDMIKIKKYPEPARPSVKNWIFDYTSNLGYESHKATVRGEYLFRNENAKKLNFFDRQKLAFLLNAFDEKGLVMVDKEEKKIVFPSSQDRGKDISSQEFPSKKISSDFSSDQDIPQDIFERRGVGEEKKRFQERKTEKIDFSQKPKVFSQDSVSSPHKKADDEVIKTTLPKSELFVEEQRPIRIGFGGSVSTFSSSEKNNVHSQMNQPKNKTVSQKNVSGGREFSSQQKAGGKMNFVYSQKMPFEKEEKNKNIALKDAMINSNDKKSIPSSKSFSNNASFNSNKSPSNVVNLKER